MINCKFSYKQKIKITKGFYANYKATILEAIKKDDTIKYKVKLESDNKIIVIEELYLRKLLFNTF